MREEMRKSTEEMKKTCKFLSFMAEQMGYKRSESNNQSALVEEKGPDDAMEESHTEEVENDEDDPKVSSNKNCGKVDEDGKED